MSTPETLTRGARCAAAEALTLTDAQIRGALEMAAEALGFEEDDWTRITRGSDLAQAGGAV